MSIRAPSLWWLRRDLRLADNPALLAAAAEGRPVVPLFVVDPVLWDGAGVRSRRLAASLHALDADLQSRYAVRLVIRQGAPADVVPAVAAEVGAETVHASAETTPY
ncbi:MAG: deoxyribodipyrimidine photo-lyase, partial [Candidatus Phosphoribacter sp.]